MSELFRAIKILEDSKALLERENGWNQCQSVKFYEDGSVSYCAYGALLATSTFNDDVGIAKYYLKLDIGDDTITTFNDKQGRTKEEIIEWFNKALERARAACST